MTGGPVKKLSRVTTDGWRGLATPAIAGAAVHYTTPWFIAVPILVVAFGLRAWQWRRRRRGGGPSGRGPFGGS